PKGERSMANQKPQFRTISAASKSNAGRPTNVELANRIDDFLLAIDKAHASPRVDPMSPNGVAYMGAGGRDTWDKASAEAVRRTVYSALYKSGRHHNVTLSVQPDGDAYAVVGSYRASGKTLA